MSADLIARLESRADSYAQSGPSSAHTAELLREASRSVGYLLACIKKYEERLSNAELSAELRLSRLSDAYGELEEIKAARSKVPTPKDEYMRGYGDGFRDGRAEAYEDMASQHEEDAQEYNRRRDPGMANHQRKYAKAFRDKAAAIRPGVQS